MKTIKQYRVIFEWQDEKGWKWADSISLWAYSLTSAEQGGKKYMDYMNARDFHEKVTGYRAYEVGA